VWMLGLFLSLSLSMISNINPVRIHIEESTKSVSLVVSDETGYSVIDADRKSSVSIPVCMQPYFGYARSSFGYIYSRMQDAIQRVKSTDNSITRFAVLNTDTCTTINFLPSADPNVVYALKRWVNLANEQFTLSLDRLEVDDTKSRQIAGVSSGDMPYADRSMEWNTDRRLKTGSEIWLSVVYACVLHGQSITASNGDRRREFRTPDGMVCLSSAILPLSSGIVLFFALKPTDSTVGVYAIDQTTSEIEHVHDASASCSTACMHEPSHTLFFASKNRINSIHLPPHLFPCPKCPCGCERAC
jgi:hypothetical protein